MLVRDRISLSLFPPALVIFYFFVSFFFLKASRCLFFFHESRISPVSAMSLSPGRVLRSPGFRVRYHVGVLVFVSRGGEFSIASVDSKKFDGGVCCLGTFCVIFTLSLPLVFEVRWFEWCGKAR